MFFCCFVFTQFPPPPSSFPAPFLLLPRPFWSFSFNAPGPFQTANGTLSPALGNTVIQNIHGGALKSRPCLLIDEDRRAPFLWAILYNALDGQAGMCKITLLNSPAADKKAPQEEDGEWRTGLWPCGPVFPPCWAP